MRGILALVDIGPINIYMKKLPFKLWKRRKGKQNKKRGMRQTKLGEAILKEWFSIVNTETRQTIENLQIIKT